MRMSLLDIQPLLCTSNVSKVKVVISLRKAKREMGNGVPLPTNSK